MKKLIVFSLLAGFVALAIFLVFTGWVFSFLAELVLLVSLIILLAISELYGRKTYRIFFVPALLPTLSFFGAGVALELGSSSSSTLYYLFLYLSTVISLLLVLRLFNYLIRDDAYFREYKHIQHLTVRKLAAVCIFNALLLSLGEMIIIYYFEG